MKKSDADYPVRAGLAFFFYANEGNEPMHVHARKGDAEVKFWLDQDRFDVVEAFEHNLTPRLRREARQIVFAHFDQICAAWKQQFGGKRAK